MIEWGGSKGEKDENLECLIAKGNYSDEAEREGKKLSYKVLRGCEGREGEEEGEGDGDYLRRTGIFYLYLEN